MKTKLWIAFLLALTLALSATPAFAQGFGIGTASHTCFGGNDTYNPGETAPDFSLMGCNGTVKSGATVPRDVALFGGNLTIENGARVSRNVAVFGGLAEIAGEVGGDVVMVGGSVHLAPTAVVDGSVRILGGALNRDEGATVRGSVTQENNFRFTPDFSRVFVEPFVNPVTGVQAVTGGLVRGVVGALALAALGALLVVLLPAPTRRVMATAEGSLWPSFGVGCLTLLILPILLILLAITLIGIPVSILLAIAAAAAWIFGWIAIGYLAGEKILEGLKVREIAPVLAVIVGVLILALVGAVPCLGGLISLLVGTLGVGAVVLTRFGTRPYPYPFTPALVPVGPMPAGPALTPPSSPTLPSAPTPTQPSAPTEPGANLPPGGTDQTPS